MAPRLELDRRTLRLIAIAFLLLATLSIHRLFFADVPNAPDVLVIEGQTMGTTYQIRVAGEGLDDRLRRRITQETTRRLDEVDAWMSNWNPESEISRFNEHRSTEPFPVSSATAEVVAYAVELSKWSGGAFDVTVGPLVARWGFGKNARVDDPPSEAEIEALRAHTGARRLRVGRGSPSSGGFLRKTDPETRVDLSAIAKGFGVDHVAAGLQAEGRADFLVEIGGEVRAAGRRPDGGLWRIAVEKPQGEGRSVQRVIELSDQAMATSGDYRIFYMDDDRRVSHTIDPRTGRPVENGPASASVVAPTATQADAWATTLMVLGEPEGLELATQWGVGALLLVRDAEGRILERSNPLFPSVVTPDAP